MKSILDKIPSKLPFPNKKDKKWYCIYAVHIKDGEQITNQLIMFYSTYTYAYTIAYNAHFQHLRSNLHINKYLCMLLIQVGTNHIAIINQKIVNNANFANSTNKKWYKAPKGKKDTSETPRNRLVGK